jgi:hypothetical protein
MSNIFGTILDKLGIKKAAPETPAPAAPAKPAAPANPAPSAKDVENALNKTPGARGTYGPPPTSTAKPAVPAAKPKPAEMPMVDVVSHLDYLAKTGPIKGLNWRMSINDLMALLGMDHSPQAIRDLAVELGCPEKEMADSYTRNVWTHKTLMQKIAENGGNIPPELQK